MHVLLLGREMRLASSIKEWLDRRHVGLTSVVEMVDPAASLQLARDLAAPAIVVVCRSFDLLVLDVCRRLGQRGSETASRFIVVAEQIAEADRIAVLDAGADAVLPGDPAAVERWVCAPGHAAVGLDYCGHDLSIGKDSATVLVRGEPVALTPREAAILRVLVHNRAGVVSRRKLELSLRGALRSRTLDVHIARLRKKLGPLGGQIQTLVKFGYRYVEPD